MFKLITTSKQIVRIQILVDHAVGVVRRRLAVYMFNPDNARRVTDNPVLIPSSLINFGLFMMPGFVFMINNGNAIEIEDTIQVRNIQY